MSNFSQNTFLNNSCNSCKKIINHCDTIHIDKYYPLRCPNPNIIECCRCNSKKKILWIQNSTRDDLLVLCVLISQLYLNSIEIIGIICEDGNVYPTNNVNLINYFIKTVLNYNITNIPVYKGIDRDPYLQQQNFFPQTVTDVYLEELNVLFNYQTDNSPVTTNINNLINQIENLPSNSLNILCTGQNTTLSYLLTNYSWFQSKICDVTDLSGNYKVNGNIIKNDPYLIPNSEYHAYFDPTAFSNVLHYLNRRLKIVPLDCTDYSHVTDEDKQFLIDQGAIYAKKTKNDFLININTNLNKLLSISVQTSIETLYWWGFVALVIFLGQKADQKNIVKNIEIDWTGKIYESIAGDNNKGYIFNYINNQKMLNLIIYDIYYKYDTYKYT